MQVLTDVELEREADELEQMARMTEWEAHEDVTRTTFKRDISHVDDPELQGGTGETPAQVKVCYPARCIMHVHCGTAQCPFVDPLIQSSRCPDLNLL